MADGDMRTVYVVGAGLSKAAALSVGAEMPITDELGDAVLARAGSKLISESAPSSFKGGHFERWLTGLAEAQPYLTEVDNARNRADLLQIVRTIAEVLVERQSPVILGLTKKHQPTWLDVIVASISFSRHQVITFNYDTILEVHSGSLETRLQNAVSRHATQDVGKLMHKLHGSVNWSWDPENPAGGVEMQTAGLGRSPFIVPPVSMKTPYYAVSKLREIWQLAYSTLKSASDVILLGYSLPPTDTTTANMFQRAIVGSGARVTIVDKCPEQVLHNLSLIGVTDERIAAVFESSTALNDYADSRLEATTNELRTWLGGVNAGIEDGFCAFHANSWQGSIVAVDSEDDRTTLRIEKSPAKNVVRPRELEQALPNRSGPIYVSIPNDDESRPPPLARLLFVPNSTPVQGQSLILAQLGPELVMATNTPAPSL